MTSDNTWQDEERIQAQRIADAIHKLIADDALAIIAQGRMPILNAVARALVTVEATMLASIVDHRKRAALQDAMQRARPRAFADAMRLGVAKSDVIDFSAPKQ